MGALEDTLMQGGGNQAAPSSQGSGDAALNPGAVKSSVEGSIQGKEHLPGMKPQTPQSGLGLKLGLATLNMFVPMLGGAVQQHIKQQKEAQVTEAVNEFSSLDSALEMASTMANAEVASGKLSQEKAHERTMELWQQQPGYKAMFDPNNKTAQKRLKNFSKVFQVDWMNPEKNQNTVHYQALQRFMKLKPASAMVKLMAGKMDEAKQNQGQPGQPQAGQAQGVQSMAQGGQSAMGSSGQPQAQPGGQPSQAASPQGTQQQPPQGQQLPPIQTVKGAPDLKGLTQYGDYLKALEQHQNHFEFHADEAGRSVAFDRRTGEAKDVKVDGQSVKLQNRAKDGIASVDGKPVGVYRVGKLRTPGDPNWTGEDQKQFDAANATWASAEAMKDRRVKLSAEARAKSWSQTRAIGVFNLETGTMEMVSAQQVADSPGKYAPPAQSMQVLNRVALFNEIDYTSKMVNEAISKLGDEPFDQELRAKLVIMLRSEDPRSYWQELLKSNVADKMTDTQVDLVTGLISLDESALSLRSLGGMGQGSDQLRSAITRMLPGAGTPSGKYFKRQMELFGGEVRQLKSTLPGLGKGQGKNAPQKSLDDTLDEVFGKKPN